MNRDFRSTAASRHWLLIAAGLLGAALAQAACPSIPTSERFSFSADGTEVTDALTGLVWQRCFLGQAWNGTTCSGPIVGYSHESALLQAQARNVSNSPDGWRLPNIRELASLVDRGCENPALDGMAFPAAFAVVWSSSPLPSIGEDRAWSVYFGTGDVRPEIRRATITVRLVRGGR
jgi:Protein of unknown function (DUF1566)